MLWCSRNLAIIIKPHLLQKDNEIGVSEALGLFFNHYSWCKLIIKKLASFPLQAHVVADCDETDQNYIILLHSLGKRSAPSVGIHWRAVFHLPTSSLTCILFVVCKSPSRRGVGHSVMATVIALQQASAGKIVADPYSRVSSEANWCDLSS